jgi:hypothetical protein
MPRAERRSARSRSSLARAETRAREGRARTCSTRADAARRSAGEATYGHTWTTAIRCVFGRSGSSTSLFKSFGSLVSSTIGRWSSSGVAATTASMAQRWPGRPVVPSNSPARRAISGLTGTTVILDSTR